MKNTATLWILGGTPFESETIKSALGKQFSVRVVDDSSAFDAFLDDQAILDSDRVPDLALIAAKNPARQQLVFRLTNSSVAPLPIMVLAGKDNTSTLLDYLSRGAVDVFARPLNLDLIAAKVAHFVGERSDQTMRRNLDLTLDRFSLAVRNGERSTLLTLKEFQLFTLLYQAYPHGVGREMLARGVWKGIRVVKKSFDVHLFNLRQKLELIGLEIQFIDRANYRLARAPRRAAPHELKKELQF